MASTLSISSMQPNPARQYERCQWKIDPGRSYAHPFDPAEVSVDVTFTAAGEQPIVVPAFWDASAFFVRFAPPTPGTFLMSVTIKDADGVRSIKGDSFTAGPATNSGFIRRAKNTRYFQFDDGRSFFPIGLNLCWAQHPAAAAWYEQAFATLQANGGNYARVWMARPGEALEGADDKLNQYSLKSAKFYDDVLASGEAHGAFIMLTMMNYREFVERDMWGPADWPNHPYNAARGGPANLPIDFFTDPEARRLFKARLRYVVARYSAYRSVAFWEFFNEEENLPFKVPPAWNAEMAAYLRQLDPAKHLITTSAHPPDSVWHLPEFDLTQSHSYGDGTFSDQIATIAQSERNHESFNKPHLIGEIGIDYHGGDAPFDPTGKGTAFHNSLWASLATGNAGTAMYWWWDSYVEPKHLWSEFKPVSAFAASVDWAHRDYRPIDIDEVWHSDVAASAVDLTIVPTGNWGDTNRDVIVVPPNGRPHTSPAKYLYGPHHKDLSAPLTFELTLPEACTMRLSLAKVSDVAVIRAQVDDKPVRDWLFSALPGANGIGRTAIDKDHALYVADVADPVELPMPAGRHRVTLQIVGGDWVTLSKIVFTHAVDGKYANLRAYAIQDAGTKDTLLWLWDTRSNWKDDRAGNPPVNASVKLVVPGVGVGTFDCTWVDTRSGAVVDRKQVTTEQNEVIISAPEFTRDIALRLSHS